MITSFSSAAQIDQEMTIYKFKVTNLEGDIFDFNTLKGKKIMIVNTASKWVSHHNIKNSKPFMKSILIKTL